MNEAIDSWIIKDWKILPKLNLIQNHESELVVKPRLMKLLEFFLLHQNEVVTKEEILNFVWEDRIVTENLLTKSISELRRLLEEKIPKQLEIETIRNVGYRFNTKFDILRGGIEQESIPEVPTSNWRKWLLLFLALVLLMGLVFFFRKPSTLDYQISFERISSLKGQEISPAISPNGAHLAFTWRKMPSSPFQIYIRALNEDNPRKLSKAEATEYNPAWSPNGQHLAFMRSGGIREVLLVKKSIIGADEVIVGKLKDLIPGRGMIWSPDGKQLIFSAKEQSNMPARLMAFDLEKMETLELTQPKENSYGDIHPSFAEKSNWLYFIRAEKGKTILSEAAPTEAQILALNLNTNKTKTITHVEGEIKEFVYHPGLGYFLCWASPQLADNQLLAIQENGQQKLLYAINNGLPGKSAPGKNQTFFFELWQSNLNVHQYPVGTSTIASSIEVYLNSTMWDWEIKFAANTNDIAFISTRTGFQEIWMASADQPSKARQITELKSPLIKSLSLSPDGQRIVWLSIEEGTSSIYAIQSNGEDLKKVVQSGNYSAPHWSDDGTAIYFGAEENGKWSIYKKRMLEETAATLIQEDGHNVFIAPSFKEDLFYSKLNQDTIYQKNLTTEKVEIIGQFPGLESPNWVVHPQGIYFLAWQKGICYLRFFEFETEEIREMKALQHILSGMPSLSISPSGEYLYIAQADEVNADIISIQFE